MGRAMFSVRVDVLFPSKAGRCVLVLEPEPFPALPPLDPSTHIYLSVSDTRDEAGKERKVAATTTENREGAKRVYDKQLFKPLWHFVQVRPQLLPFYVCGETTELTNGGVLPASSLSLKQSYLLKPLQFNLPLSAMELEIASSVSYQIPLTTIASSPGKVCGSCPVQHIEAWGMQVCSWTSALSLSVFPVQNAL